MGADIHLYVEKKNAKTGEWEAVKGRNPRIDSYREWAADSRNRGETDRALQLEKEANDIESGAMLVERFEKLEEWYPKKEREMDEDLQKEYESELNSLSDFDAPERFGDWIYDGRNYDLFAILANVRNGRGFAGCDTGDGFVPISMPKNLPSDVSDYVEMQSEGWGCDGHSHSYLSLKEILDYDWFQVTTQRGVVGEEEYKLFKEKGEPVGYSGGVFGQTVVNVTNIEMDMIISGQYKKEEGKSYYTQIFWKEPYFEAAGSFYTESIAKLEKLSDGDPESVRIVFWFDN